MAGIKVGGYLIWQALKLVGIKVGGSRVGNWRTKEESVSKASDWE